MLLVQSVLLLGSELYVNTPHIVQSLGSLHNWVAQLIYGRMPWCHNGLWEYPPIGEALSDTGLDPIGEYISQCNIILEQYISTRPIFDLMVSEESQTRSPETIISRVHEGIWFINEGRVTDKSEVEGE